jgi:hypothetical protein
MGKKYKFLSVKYCVCIFLSKSKKIHSKIKCTVFIGGSGTGLSKRSKKDELDQV